MKHCSGSIYNGPFEDSLIAVYSLGLGLNEAAAMGILLKQKGGTEMVALYMLNDPQLKSPDRCIN